MAKAKSPTPANGQLAQQFYLGDTVASVFTRPMTGKNGKWTSYSVSIQRSYYDAQARKTSYRDSLFESDLLSAGECLRSAYQWIEQDRRAKRTKAAK